MGLLEMLRSMFDRMLIVSYRDADYEYDGTARDLLYDVEGLPDGYHVEVAGAQIPPDATNGEVELSATNVTVTSKQGRDVTRRFTVVLKPAHIRVRPAPLTVVSGSAHKVWDGNELSCGEVAVKGLVAGETLNIRAVGRLTDEGAVQNDVVIDWDSSTAKRENYALALKLGTLSVEKAFFVATGRNVEVVYDGTPHSFEVDAPGGARVVFSDNARHATVGAYATKFVASLPHHFDVKGTARMNIVDSSSPVQVKVLGGSYVYDGQEHRATVEVEGVPKGYRLVQACSHAMVRNVSDGVVTAICDELRIEDDFGVDATARLNIVFDEPATLMVRPASLSVSSESASKVWDGEPLVNQVVRVEGLADGEHLSAGAVGEIADVGSCLNEVSIDWGVSSACESNYAVDIVPGTLAIEPADISGVEVERTAFVYDGYFHSPIIRIPEGACLRFEGKSAFTAPGHNAVHFTVSMPNHRSFEGVAPLDIENAPDSVSVKLTGGTFPFDGLSHEAEVEVSSLPAGCRLMSARTNGSVRNVSDGVVMATLAELRIGDWEGNDATEYLKIAYSGSVPLAITPAPLIILSESAHKVWDGRPLTCDGLKVEGLIDGDNLKLCACGTVTDVGAAANLIAVDWSASTARRENYQVTLVPGTLTVDPAPLEVEACDLELVYDGLSHGFEVEAPEGATVRFGDESEHVLPGEYQTSFVVTMPNHRETTGEVVLTIVDSPVPIVVKTCGGEFTYDGREHGATVEVSALPEGYVLAEARSTASVRDVDDGVVPATCDVLCIENCAGEDVTDRLNIVHDDSTLQVMPKKLLVTTQDARHLYDGKPACAGGRVHLLVEGETVTLKVTGSQTEVGESPNTYELLFDGSAKQSNYTVGERLGTLRVLSPTVQPQVPKAPVPTPVIKTISKPAKPTMPKTAPVVPSQDVPWTFPTIRARSSVGGGTRSSERRREYRARPVEERRAFEEEGYGPSFRPYANLDLQSPSDRDLVRTMRDLDERACGVIDDLLERNPNGLLFECFDNLGIETNTFKEAFARLLKNYADKRYALAWIDRNCRDAFLIYVAALSNELYDGDALWQNLFAEICLRGDDICDKFKRMFVAYLYQRSMVVFEPNKRHTYMVDSAVLHGGFSVAVWEDLWKNCFLSLARSRGSRAAEMTGKQVIARMLEDRGQFRPRNHNTLELLRRFPRESLESLCSLAWKVALEVQGARKDDYSRSGLPDTALLALRKILMPNVNPVRSKQEVCYLKDASLVLDKAAGTVRLTWPNDPFPLSMVNARVDVLINGELVRTVRFERRADHCLLGGGTIDLPPFARYDLERRVVVPDSHDGTKQCVVASSTQYFQNSKPGCFEFVRDRQGIFRFRDPNRRLAKASRVAYLVEEDKRVEGIHGMRLIDSVECCGDWANMMVYEFEVEPGAAGVIRDVDNNEVVTAWNEDYRVRIDKSCAIGIAGGLDLYGHVLGVGETDVALPSIDIEALGDQVMGDVAVRCICDGQPGELESSWTYDNETGAAHLYLKFPSTETARGIVPYCVIEAQQRSTGDMLLRYRFAIVPIQGFRLEDWKLRDGNREFVGIYQYEVTETLFVKDVDEDAKEERFETGSSVNIQRSLCDDGARMEMRDLKGATLTVDLYLVGVEISMPQELLSAAENTSYIGLPTKSELMYTVGDIVFTVKAPRRGRYLAVNLGDLSLADRKLDKAGDIKVNIFADDSAFRPVDEREFVPMELTVTIGFGLRLKDGAYVPAMAHYKCLVCGKGLEFQSCEIRYSAERATDVLRFTGKRGREMPPCSLQITFFDRWNNKLDEPVEVARGQSCVELPPYTKRAYEDRQTVVLRAVPRVGLFEVLDDANAWRKTFVRGNRNNQSKRESKAR